MSRLEVTFRDGEKQLIKKCDLVAASYLMSGDIVGVRSTRQDYEEGLVLEYQVEYDQFYVASHSGIVFR